MPLVLLALVLVLGPRDGWCWQAGCQMPRAQVQLGQPAAVLARLPPVASGPLRLDC